MDGWIEREVAPLPYPAWRAAPSAAATLLVSSWEIWRASARCMSVMVQKEATRWSAGRSHSTSANQITENTQTVLHIYYAMTSSQVIISVHIIR